MDVEHLGWRRCCNYYKAMYMVTVDEVERPQFQYALLRSCGFDHVVSASLHSTITGANIQAGSKCVAADLMTYLSKLSFVSCCGMSI